MFERGAAFRRSRSAHMLRSHIGIAYGLSIGTESGYLERTA